MIFAQFVLHRGVKVGATKAARPNQLAKFRHRSNSNIDTRFPTIVLNRAFEVELFIKHRAEELSRCRVTELVQR
jgi:hypothetical protein